MAAAPGREARRVGRSAVPGRPAIARQGGDGRAPGRPWPRTRRGPPSGEPRRGLAGPGLRQRRLRPRRSIRTNMRNAVRPASAYKKRGCQPYIQKASPSGQPVKASTRTQRAMSGSLRRERRIWNPSHHPGLGGGTLWLLAGKIQRLSESDRIQTRLLGRRRRRSASMPILQHDRCRVRPRDGAAISQARQRLVGRGGRI